MLRSSTTLRCSVLSMQARKSEHKTYKLFKPAGFISGRFHVYIKITQRCYILKSSKPAEYNPKLFLEETRNEENIY